MKIFSKDEHFVQLKNFCKQRKFTYSECVVVYYIYKNCSSLGEFHRTNFYSIFCGKVDLSRNTQVSSKNLDSLYKTFIKSGLRVPDMNALGPLYHTVSILAISFMFRDIKRLRGLSTVSSAPYLHKKKGGRSTQVRSMAPFFMSQVDIEGIRSISFSIFDFMKLSKGQNDRAVAYVGVYLTIPHSRFDIIQRQTPTQSIAIQFVREVMKQLSGTVHDLRQYLNMRVDGHDVYDRSHNFLYNHAHSVMGSTQSRLRGYKFTQTKIKKGWGTLRFKDHQDAEKLRLLGEQAVKDAETDFYEKVEKMRERDIERERKLEEELICEIDDGYTSQACCSKIIQQRTDELHTQLMGELMMYFIDNTTYVSQGTFKQILHDVYFPKEGRTPVYKQVMKKMLYNHAHDIWAVMNAPSFECAEFYFKTVVARVCIKYVVEPFFTSQSTFDNWQIEFVESGGKHIRELRESLFQKGDLLLSITSRTMKFFNMFAVLPFLIHFKMSPSAYYDEDVTEFMKESPFKKYKGVLDLKMCIILTCADVVLDFLEVGWTLAYGKAGDLHNGHQYGDWFKEVVFLKQEMHVRDLEGHLSADDFEIRAQQAREVGDRIFLQNPNDKIIASTYKEIKGVTESLALEFRTSGEREMPFSIMLQGKPGCGKTTATASLFATCASVYGLKYTSNMVYKVTKGKFHPGLSTQPFYEFDDFNATYPNGKDIEASEYGDFLDMLNTTVVPSNQADVDSKGKKCFMQKVNIFTTMVGFQNANLIFQDCGGLYRRVQVAVKMAAKPHLTGLKGEIDPDKTLKSGEHPSLYTICEINDLGEFVPMDSKSNMEVGPFLREVKKMCIEHRRIEKLRLDGRKHMSELCDCGIPQMYCDTCKFVSQAAATASGYFYAIGWLMTLLQEIPTRQHMVFYILYACHMSSVFAANYGLEFYLMGIKFLTWSFVWVSIQKGYRKMTHYLLAKTSSFEEKLAHMKKTGERKFKEIVASIDIGADALKRMSVCAGVVTVVVATYVAYNAMSSKEEKKEEPKSQGLEQTWEKENDDGTTQQSRSISRKDFKRKIQANFYKITRNCSIKNKAMSTSILFIKGNHFIGNIHMLEGAQEILIEKQCEFESGINLKVVVWNPVLVHKISHDLGIYQLHNFKLHKDITPYITGKRFTQGFVEVKGIKTGGKLGRGPWTREVPNMPSVFEYVQDVRVMYNIGQRLRCGEPILSANHNIILGFHVAGKESTNSSLGETITRNDVAVTIDAYSVKSQAHEEIGALSKKSSFYYNKGNGIAKGTTSRIPPKLKSRVHPVLHSEKVVGVFGTDIKRFVAPSFTRSPTNPLSDPWHMNLRTLVAERNFRTVGLERAVSSYKEKLAPIFSIVQPLNLHQAINGIDGHPFIHSINVQTSMGYGYNSRKSNVLVQDLTDKWYLPDKLDKIYHSMWVDYGNGVSWSPIFTGSLKDEPVTVKKFEDRKVRLFGATETLWGLMARSLFLPILIYFRGRFEKSEMAIGANAYGRDWDRFHKYLTRFGEDSIIAGDFKGFDKSIRSRMILAAFDIFIDFAKQSGYTEENIKRMKTIAYDVAFPHYDIKSDVFQAFGTNPSGHFFTTYLNSVVNSLWMRTAYYVMGFNNFNENINPLTYGDDNAMGVDKKCGFTAKHLAEGMIRANGIIYTNFDKKEFKKNYYNISEINFLKRGFKPENGFIYAPLEKDSIAKSLSLTSSMIDRNIHFISACESAIIEMAIIGGPDYEKFIEVYYEIYENECAVLNVSPRSKNRKELLALMKSE